MSHAFIRFWKHNDIGPQKRRFGSLAKTISTDNGVYEDLALKIVAGGVKYAHEAGLVRFLYVLQRSGQRTNGRADLPAHRLVCLSLFRKRS